jgi:ubiquinone/menaquinone biosynthesis C-methylase UbiE
MFAGGRRSKEWQIMSVYEEFAQFYARGPWDKFSKAMAECLPAVLERFDRNPKTVLDLACGEGTFAVEMAKSSYRVTAVDMSPEMLELAKAKADSEGVHVDFLHQDICSLSVEGEFDLVTCWYDSLNYILDVAKLETAFANARRVLKSDGLFVFDMNTIYGLAVNWQTYPAVVQIDTDDLLLLSRPGYDFETNTATLNFTGFARRGDSWHRTDELHKERGYTLEEIRRCLAAAGLKELACWGSMREMSEPKADSGRLWFVAEA